MSRGVTASVLASVLFAVLFYYATLLDPLDGMEVFGWRMLFNAPVITLLILLSREWHLVPETLIRIRRSPSLGVGVIVCAVLIGMQLWVFVWGPVNDRALEVSLGFFLMPLTLVLAGWVVFGDRLTRPQQVAAVIAVIGVGNELIRVGGISWVTVLIALGYPTYFSLRRRLRTDHQGGVWLEMHLVLPVALGVILAGPNGIGVLGERTALLWLIPGLGLLSGLGLSSHFLASRLLTFGLFGLLIYVEPVLLVVVAFLLGERIGSDQWLTYGAIWLALSVLFIEGVVRLRLRYRQRRLQRAMA